MVALTKKQEQALLFIRDTSESNHTPPTLRELCQYMGYRAIGSAQDVVASLRRKGYLKPSDSHKARSLIVSEAGYLYGRSQDDLLAEDGSFKVPCLGRVPAGNPVEAVEERVGLLRVSQSLLSLNGASRKPRLFAVQAEGESMINAGILDGDWLVVKCQDEGEKGDIVVARLADEATVKRLARDRKGWYLKPENDAFEPIYAKDRPFEVIGKVVALQRTLH